MNLKEKIESLIVASNKTTGNADDNLTDCVETLRNGYGSGSSVENTKVGTAVMPDGLFDTKFIETGFTPKSVTVYVYDDKQNMNTYTTCCGYDESHQTGTYYQSNGFTRSFTANNTTGGGRGHVIGVSDTGFTIMSCEDFFAGLPCRYVAIG